jgi:signal peptidase II
MARTMPKQTSSGSLAPWLGVSLIVILFDQLSKIAVARVFTYGEPHALTPFFNLFLIFNRGAAFSFLASAGGWQRWGFTALGVVAAIVICSSATGTSGCFARRWRSSWAARWAT